MAFIHCRVFVCDYISNKSFIFWTVLRKESRAIKKTTWCLNSNNQCKPTIYIVWPDLDAGVSKGSQNLFQNNNKLLIKYCFLFVNLNYFRMSDHYK